MNKNPVRGMRDFTPVEMELREYVLKIIEDVAIQGGYQKIETPAVEYLENLSSKEGGENENLIFKIMKRGKSLVDAKEKGSELADGGLRYDLTVPLARYFANNQANLCMPFKALQIGPVWRADRPQKGRFRQFLQCDMDILGESTILAEIDTIITTIEILSKIFKDTKVSDITIHLNDRRFLTAAASFAGFIEADFSSVLITLDKNDKIGWIGVKDELIKLGYDSQKVVMFTKLFEDIEDGITIDEFCYKLGDSIPTIKVIEDLKSILEVITKLTEVSAKIIFDPTLVRGMGYYTGPIFECSLSELSSSVAGGGRYDKMIGKFSGGTDVSACGFSIGFERIITILNDLGFSPEFNKEKMAILVNKKISTQRLTEVFASANLLRSEKIVSVLPMRKNIKFQIEMLEKDGYSLFDKIFK